MNSPRSVSPLLYAGVALVSAVALGLEILLTRVLALMMWHHLTYVVIGVALLGFGAAGSHVMVRNARERDRLPPLGRRLARYSLGLTLSVPLCYVAMIHVRIAPLALLDEPQGIVALLLVYALIALPFYFAGLAICDAIESCAERIGSVYFFDLLGAGAGAVGAVFLIEPLTGPGAMMAFAAVSGLGAACFALDGLGGQSGAGKVKGAIQALIGLGLAAFLGLVALPAARDGQIDPPLAPSKELAKGMGRGFEVAQSVWNPLARIDVSEAIHGPLAGMGGAFPEEMPAVNSQFIFQDGTAPTVFLEWDGDPAKLSILRDASAAAGYLAHEANGKTGVRSMAIGVGGGADLLIASSYGAETVTGVEINRSTIRLLEEDYAEFTGGLAARENVELVHAEGRHFARASGRKFDLIQLSGVDTYTALSTGAYTLSESYLYTREAIEEFWHALEPDGIISYSRIVFEDRPRETLRLAATAVEALELQGIENPADHLFLMSGGKWASLLICRQPLAEPALVALRGLVDRHELYRLIYDPGQPQANAFDKCIRLDPAEREAFYDEYPFDVRPAVDDKPFFFNYFKWKGLLDSTSWGGHVYEQKYPVGHACMVIGLLQTLLLGAWFILRPIARLADGRGRTNDREPSRGGTLAAFLYFSALGIGFIVVEVVLMQRFVLFLGHPTVSLTTVLPTMLIAAGLGSLTVRPTSDPKKRIALLILLVPAVIFGGWYASDHMLDALLDLVLWQRIAVAAALLTPIGFVLGMAFPSGVTLVGERRPELVPWVWAINSFTTVLGSTGAVLAAMEVGFSVVMLATIPLYAIGLIALLAGFRGAPEPSVSGSAAG